MNPSDEEGRDGMRRLVLTTFAIMKEPYGHETVQGFEELTPLAFGAAEAHPGFVARATEVDDRPDLSNFERDWGAWGPFCTPRFYRGGTTLDTDSRASTISVWEDLASVFDYVYTGVHRQALAGRQEWFRKPEWPTYAMWWVTEGEPVTWRDASDRVEHYHDHGSTPRAFDFRHPFGPDGAEAPRPRRARAAL